ncbi:hypothetical protein D0C36_08140 [Mucilaginibacter conchicola]|uniref:DUF4270 family protein n=1 Tax=Mucilaginibacter conchicola TaxID=2303333 RepID=A0A372P168_9SPHI|nr:hypothetical protein [Mucilaginibacter conchicola]RFZ95854.1 hypothetical protein D0C36_08140 [Mucilaginibacter conchicola]
MKKQLLLLFSIIMAGTLLFTGCVKVDYTKIDSPAYLRVFNDLPYTRSLDVKDAKVPFFCMIINPTFDASGKVSGGQIVGDFLDTREPYAPPYPSHIGSSTSVNNPEYPGKENVLVGPILNGYDLSSWAQIPSGKLRVMFLYRPKNTVPYFKLENALIGDVMVDTTLDFSAKEVYTMHLLQQKYTDSKSNKVLLRQENFQKLPLSDSLNYVNFYNYSAEGFVEADNSKKQQPINVNNLMYGIRDRMDVYLTIYPNQDEDANARNLQGREVKGFNGQYLTTMVRSTTLGTPATYVSYPLFPDKAASHITTKSWQVFDFYSPGTNPTNSPYYFSDYDTQGNWGTINCIADGQVYVNGNIGQRLPNTVINIHSGVNNPQSFASVNTIEVVNGAAYLMTIQRKYPAPQY